MPSLFKQKTVAYFTREGRKCKSDTPGAIRKVSKSKNWYGQYRDAAGKTHRVPLCPDKGVAKDMLAKLVNDASMAKVGITDPYVEHRHRPLPEHLEDFRTVLAAKGNTAVHVARTVSYIQAVITDCGFAVIADIEESAVLRLLEGRRRDKGEGSVPPGKPFFTVKEVAELLGVKLPSVHRLVKRGHLRCQGRNRNKKFDRNEVIRLLTERGRGIGVETSNHYLTAMKAFTKWLVGNRRTDTNPLIHLGRQNARVDRRRARRALPDEEFNRFVEATATGETFRGLTGGDRLVLYTLAAQTGLRAAELASLSPRSFSLATRPYAVTVEAGYSKHRQEDRQPLRDDTAEMMKQYIAARPAKAERLWPGKWYKAAAEMVRLDLVAAGIPYRDGGGRYFDFHSIRGQFISSLAASGVHPKVAQVLARHSTITLTMDHYTHLDVMDVAGALAKLPAVRGKKNDQSEEQNAA